MAKLKSGKLLSVLQSIQAESGACIVLLYLAEAHSKEQWPLSHQAPAAHGDAAQRLVAAEALLASFPTFRVLLDGNVYTDIVSNDTTLACGLWPERYLLLERDRVQWASTLSFEARATYLPGELHAAASALWAPQPN